MEIIETLTVAITFVGPRGSRKLASVESAIIKILRDAGGNAMSGVDLARLVWPAYPPAQPDRCVATHVHRIRLKLTDIGISPEIIASAPGKGYRFGG
jgi:DNA-binding response OmpR family regulator